MEREKVDEIVVNVTEKIRFSWWMSDNGTIEWVDIRRYFLDAYGEWIPGIDGLAVNTENVEEFSLITSAINRTLKNITEDQDQSGDQEDYDQEQYEGEDQITDNDR